MVLGPGPGLQFDWFGLVAKFTFNSMLITNHSDLILA